MAPGTNIRRSATERSDWSSIWASETTEIAWGTLRSAVSGLGAADDRLDPIFLAAAGDGDDLRGVLFGGSAGLALGGEGGGAGDENKGGASKGAVEASHVDIPSKAGSFRFEPAKANASYSQQYSEIRSGLFIACADFIAKSDYSAASSSSAPPRSTETIRLTPRSTMVTPNSRCIRLMVTALWVTMR